MRKASIHSQSREDSDLFKKQNNLVSLILKILNRFKMAKKIICFVVIIISIQFFPLFSNFKAQVNDKKSISVFTVKEGLIYKPESEVPYTGKVKSVVKEKKFEKIIEYDVVNGLMDGEFKIYSSEGKLEMHGNMSAGKNEGLWQYFYANGKIESKGLFKDDAANGMWKWYYENGSLREEGNYADGKRTGTWKMYDSTGRLIEKVLVDTIQQK